MTGQEGQEPRTAASMLGRVKVFISWSGDQARSVAEILKGWLETVLAGRVSAWVSSQDIAKGERGLSVVAKELEAGTFGLVVVTRSNSAAPWINFEAGALGKSLGEARVATALVDLTPADISGPLAQFQATALSDHDDVLKLVKDIAIAAESGTTSIPTETIELLFASKWPELETAITAAAGGKEPMTARSDKDILEEVLEVVRGIARQRAPDVAAYSQALMERSLAYPPNSDAKNVTFSARLDDLRAARMKTFRDHYGGSTAVMKTGEILGEIVNWEARVDGTVTVHIEPAVEGRPHLKLPVTEIEVVSAF